MNKKKIIIIAIAILSCILISFIGERSFSKYVSEVRGDATAEIATWYFKVNGETEMIQNIKLASNYNLETIAKDKIAPGTKGSFKIKIKTNKDIEIPMYIAYAKGARTGETEEQKKHNNDIDTQESQTIKNYSFDVVVTGTQMKPQ